MIGPIPCGACDGRGEPDCPYCDSEGQVCWNCGEPWVSCQGDCDTEEFDEDDEGEDGSTSVDEHLDDAALLERLAEANAAVAIDAEYEHRKTGARYVVIGIALEEATCMPVVVYQSISTLLTWTRPLGEFQGRFVRVAED